MVPVPVEQVDFVTRVFGSLKARVRSVAVLAFNPQFVAIERVLILNLAALLFLGDEKDDHILFRRCDDALRDSGGTLITPQLGKVRPVVKFSNLRWSKETGIVPGYNEKD